MSLPPRCYYCRRVMRWPWGIVLFRGSVQWHIAHRACLAKKRAHPYAHLARSARTSAAEN